MENLNAEQVKKALECCAAAHSSYCRHCPIDIKKQENCECGTFLAGQALALINKQETEYNELYELLQTYKADSEAYRSYSKTLEKENEGLKTLLDESYDTQNALTKENERLRAENEMLLNVKNLNIDKVIADTVRKMQERLKEHLEKPEFPWDSFTVAEEVIDQIAKEMLEGK